MEKNDNNIELREIAQENYINFGIFLLFWAYLGFRARYTHLAYDAPILSYFDNVNVHVQCLKMYSIYAITHNNVWEQSQLEISPVSMGSFLFLSSFFLLPEWCECSCVFTYICLFPNGSTRFGSFQIYQTYIFMTYRCACACGLLNSTVQ